jgi:hypothetical protein
MRQCEQMPGMNVLEHGESVHSYYLDLISHLDRGTPLKYEWKLPEWINEPALAEKTTSLETARMYHHYHDCGKPMCLVIDSEGKRYFPEHARYSEELWRSSGGPENIARLIGMDMDIHLLKDEGIAEFVTRDECATLLLTGLAEIHSNASMFGGIESTSFKIKLKHIDRRGKKVAAYLGAIT